MFVDVFRSEDVVHPVHFNKAVGSEQAALVKQLRELEDVATVILNSAPNLVLTIDDKHTAQCPTINDGSVQLFQRVFTSALSGIIRVPTVRHLPVKGDVRPLEEVRKGTTGLRKAGVRVHKRVRLGDVKRD